MEKEIDSFMKVDDEVKDLLRSRSPPKFRKLVYDSPRRHSKERSISPYDRVPTKLSQHQETLNYQVLSNMQSQSKLEQVASP